MKCTNCIYCRKLVDGKEFCAYKTPYWIEEDHFIVDKEAEVDCQVFSYKYYDSLGVEVR